MVAPWLSSTRREWAVMNAICALNASTETSDGLALLGRRLPQPGRDAARGGVHAIEAGREQQVAHADRLRVGMGDRVQVGHAHRRLREAALLRNDGEDLDDDPIVAVVAVGGHPCDGGRRPLAGEKLEHHPLCVTDVLIVAQIQALANDVLQRRPLRFQDFGQVLVDPPRLGIDGALPAVSVDPPGSESLLDAGVQVGELPHRPPGLHVPGRLGREKEKLACPVTPGLTSGNMASWAARVASSIRRFCSLTFPTSMVRQTWP